MSDADLDAAAAALLRWHARDSRGLLDLMDLLPTVSIHYLARAADRLGSRRMRHPARAARLLVERLAAGDTLDR
jgi:hypothetical protein